MSKRPRVQDDEGEALEADSFELRQVAMRAIERMKTGREKPIDTLFCVHALYMQHPDEPGVALILDSFVRPAFIHPIEFLNSVEASAIPPLLEELASLALIPSASEYWRLCQHYVKAIDAQRSIPENAMNDVIREKVLELLLNCRGRYDALWTETRCLCNAKVPGVSTNFYAVVEKFVDVMRWEDRLEAYVMTSKRTEAPPPPPSYGPGNTFRGEMTAADCEVLMAQQGVELEQGEQIMVGEVQLTNDIAAKTGGSGRKKPQYFNRIVTGYEWNRYNKTHYDVVKNPPPKVVNGYKFSIFYPDLIGSSRTPRFVVEPTQAGWEDEHCILRFIAGPPYDDVAFLIVNRQWNERKGSMNCSFERGVLNLRISLQRTRYRR
jgi:hypothetical protein